jgi:PBP1b-binding outer membrane lipoprotein LpoB
MVFASQQRPPMNANYGYALIRAIAAKKHHVVQVLLQTSYSLYAQLLYDNNYNYSCLGLHVAVLNRDIPMILLLRAYNYPDTAADHLGTATEFAANRQQWGCLNALIHKNPKEEYLKYQKEQAEKEKQLIEAKKQNIATTLKKNAYELNDKIIQHYKPNNGNKEELVNDIINHAGENKQQALLECMVPETYLGKILHEKRGLWAPVPHRGCLKKVMEALQNEIIDWKTVDSKIVNKILSNADIKRHYPNFYERVAIFSREEKQATEAYPAENPYTNDKPPAYKDAMKEKANPVIYMPIRTETSTRKMSR